MSFPITRGRWGWAKLAGFAASMPRERGEIASVTLYTPGYRERKNGLKSEHYAKNLKYSTVFNLFCLTK
ncbi:MAG: hypothetical protein IKJ99_08060 [Oscillospiraceae bacterium]|nr:hypothetical protein [Oscillospiraceae bacterium]